MASRLLYLIPVIGLTFLLIFIYKFHDDDYFDD